jgi:hypothetical protein
MFFDFIDTAYSCIILVFIVAIFLIKKHGKIQVQNLIATSNTVLIFYAGYLIKQFYNLIQFALSLKIDPKQLPKENPSIGWFEIRYLLLMLLPFAFISKTMAKNYIATIVMLVLLQWDFLVIFYQALFTSQSTSGILFYLPYNIEFKIMHFISLFIGTYALLWLLKRLPSQQTNK